MSLFGLERSSTVDPDVADHAINLVDSTKSQPQSEANYDDSDRTPSLIGAVATRQGTRDHLRKELARRKYAKWQDGKDLEPAVEEIEHAEGDPKNLVSRPSILKDKLRDKLSFHGRKKQARRSQDLQTFVDVLYENQRGWWLCGIPLYSSNSLLNLDPAAWQTSTFQDSPVNITNAQVPDPSWQWAWRHWYVDMSYDVDEEGWQYSFSFNTYFSWHGNHPWYHSYVRRRRWLRKRVKKDAYQPVKRGVGMKEAHHLNPDYFTIHSPGQDRSRDSSVDHGTTRHSSLLEGHAEESEDDEAQEIENTTALAVVLKKARVDREKIAAVRLFLEHGGDELHYLAQNMPAILDDLIHQSSRRQLLFMIRDFIPNRNRKKQDDGEKIAERSDSVAENLQKALDAGRSHAKQAGYWTDLGSPTTNNSTALANNQSSEDSSNANIDQLEKIDSEIKGLPSQDHFAEPHIGNVPQSEAVEDSDDDKNGKEGREVGKREKGKGKA